MSGRVKASINRAGSPSVRFFINFSFLADKVRVTQQITVVGFRSVYLFRTEKTTEQYSTFE